MAAFVHPSSEFFSLPVLGANLGDAQVPATPFAFGVSESFPIDLTEGGKKVGAVTLAVSAQSGLVVINDAKDPNVFDLFDLGKKPAAKPGFADPLTLGPVLTFNPEKAYVVINGLTASGKLSGEAGLPGWDFGLEAARSLEVGMAWECRRDETLLDAVKRTLPRFRTLFSVEDLATLDVGETLVLGVSSRLKLSVGVTLSTLAEAIAGGLKVAGWAVGGVALKASVGAKIALSVASDGSHRIYAQRGATNGSVAIQLRWATEQSVDVGGSLGLTVELKDPAALLAPLKAVVGQITGLPSALIDRILVSDTLDNLSEDEKKWIDLAVAKLKLRDPQIAAWKELKKALEAGYKAAESQLKQKVEFGFSASWRRTTKESVIAAFELSEESLRRHHVDLLRLNLEPLLADVHVVWTSYLGQKSREVKINWGFGLSLGKLTIAKGVDERTETYVWQRDREQRQRIAFRGTRSYAGTFFNETKRHLAELDAAMPRFTASPRAEDFDLSYRAVFAWENDEFSDVVASVADTAAIVGAVATADVPTAVKLFQDAGLPGQVRGDAKVEISLPARFGRVLTGRVSQALANGLAAQALGRAFPYGRQGEDHLVRRQVETRSETYGRVFATLFAEPWASPERVAQVASNIVGKVDKKQGELERSATNGISTLALVQSYGKLRDVAAAIDDLKIAFQLLAALPEAGTRVEVFTDALRALSTLNAHPHGGRVFGALLFLAARLQPEWLRVVERRVVFTWQEGGEERTLVFSQGGDV